MNLIVKIKKILTHIWFLGVQRRAEFALFVIRNSMPDTDRNCGAAGKKDF